MTAVCGCGLGPGRHITDLAKHASWHELVLAQGGPDGAVNANTLRAARGFQTGTLTGETILDRRARENGKRASGKLREASR